MYTVLNRFKGEQIIFMQCKMLSLKHKVTSIYIYVRNIQLVHLNKTLIIDLLNIKCF